ncbi:MAG: ABC transporter ATP-binding protein [Candidatus Bipolaricaulota bacterium]
MNERERSLSGEAVRLEGIVKRFPGVTANAGIDLSLNYGEVHGLLGENGAGKTVLMSVLYGLYLPTEGQIYLDGRPVSISSPAVAIRSGIGMVHQHFMLVPRLTVADNMVVGWETSWGPFLDRSRIRQRIRELSEQYGMEVDPNAVVEELSVGEQQRVEIVKALYRGAEVLILDEPTATLPEQEVESFFTTIRALRDEGKAIVFITHKLGEALTICDQVTVLRKGEKVGTVPSSEATEAQLAEMMVGREVVFEVQRERVASEGRPLLQVEGLSAVDDRHVPAVQEVGFTVHDHEIVGVAGVQGNGQSELVEVICGLRRASQGRVVMDGAELTSASPRRMAEAGLVHIPEDRQRRGLILNFTLAENSILGRQYEPPFAIGHVGQSKRAIAGYARELVERFKVVVPGVRTPVRALSGGNQQRVILARELDRTPKVIVAAQPTRGLDVAGIEFVWEQLLAMRREGAGILLVSMDLDELMTLSDRLVVMYQGKLVGERKPRETDKQEIGLLMLGGTVEAA